MNCIIIEDEHHAAKHLEYQLSIVDKEINVLATIDSVKKAVTWLKNNQTDLIFLDVQLGDGLSFEIFDHIELNTPVIFTTSYDQYAIQAFEVNSIAYLLKPIKNDGLKSALNKYKMLNNQEVSISDKVVPLYSSYQKRFLIQAGNVVKSVPVDDVAYFRVQNKRYVILTMKDGQQLLLDNTLERLEQRLDPEKFFRINRQFIVNIDAIHNMINHDDRGRLKIETQPESKEEMILSIDKIASFKNWLDI